MALALRITGPGLDVVRELQAGDPELVLGRDADCGVCLPDPQRNVSRRHLSVWLEDGELRFRVLSVVNGVEMAFGEAPPGARGVLPLGQALKVGDYSLHAAARLTGEDGGDPWAALQRDGSGTVPAQAAPGGAVPAAAPAQDDPFAEWGFEGQAEAGASRSALPAAGPQSGDMAAFYRGLGLDPASVGALSEGEIQAIGALTRVLMLGVLELHANAQVIKDDLRAEDRTMVAAKDNNPLKSDWPRETKLRYVFGGRTAGIGFPNPERALRELLMELLAHDGASSGASRSALQSTLKEFAPAALKSRLLGSGGNRLFEGTRAWDAYCKYYAQQGVDMAQWTQRMLDRYYTEAYLRESLRIKRETPRREP
jgi:predicted component of type VI protein secretion system